MKYKAFKTELKPNNKQKTLFLKHAGCARVVYNWGLNLLKEDYESGRKELKPNAYALSKLLTQKKKTDFPWMKELSSETPAHALANLESAYKRFFKTKKGFPQFKKKGKHDSFSVRSSITVYDNKIKLPKIGIVRLKESGYIPLGKPKSATISLKAGRWFISVSCEVEPEKIKYNDDTLGVDLGIKSLVTCSDGTVIKNKDSIKIYEKKLSKLQKKLARQQKGSKSRENTKKSIQKVYFKITNIRKDVLHKTTSLLVKAKPEGTIVIEDLNVKGMVKNRKLARAISRIGFGEFRRQIEYKSDWYGKKVVIADRFFPSSKMDHKTGEVNENLKLSDRIIYHSDGTFTDRDLNAAINLRNYAAGLAAGGDGKFIESKDSRCPSVKPKKNRKEEV